MRPLLRTFLISLVVPSALAGAVPGHAQVPKLAVFRKQLLDSLQKAASAKANTVAAGAHIATMSLVKAERYPLFSNVGRGERFFGRFFMLDSIRFHLENGRLYRVMATGSIVRDSLYKERKANPDAARIIATQAVIAKDARDSAKVARQVAVAVQTQANGAKKAAQRQALLRISGQFRRKAAGYEQAAQAADVLARTTAADSAAAIVPANSTLSRTGGVKRTNALVKGAVIFTNLTSVIDLNNPATSGYVDALLPDDFAATTPNYALRFLDLVRVHPASGRRLVPDNDTWKFSPTTTTEYKLTAGAPLGGLLDVALYTDLLAALNNEDNALVTTEIGSYLPLNQRLLGRNSHFRLLAAVRPSLALARLDSKFDTLRMQRDSLIDRPNLLQRSYLRVGVNLNLLTFDNRRHVTYHLNGSWTRSLTSVAGVAGTADSDNRRNVYQNLYGLEALMTVRRQRNFGADLYFSAYLHNVQSRRFIENNGAEWALRPGALFYYHPFGSPSNKLFFRFSNFIFPSSRQRDFFQVQVGYSIGLSGLFNGEGQSTPSSLNETNGHLPSTQ